MLTDVYRTIDPPQTHRQPVEDFPLFLHSSFREGLINDPEQQMGWECRECERGAVLRWERRRAEGAGFDIGRGWWKHKSLLVEDDHAATTASERYLSQQAGEAVSSW